MKITYLILFLSCSLASFSQAPFGTPDNIGSGNCLDFDGTNDYVEVPADPTLVFNQITFCAWVKPTNNNENYCFFSTGAASATGVVFEYAGGITERLRIGHYAGSPVDLNTGVTLKAGEWQHVAFVYEVNSSATIYVNGVLVGTRNDITSTANMIGPYRIGTRWNDSFWHEGQIDDARVWNRLLTQAEIRDNMCKQLEGNEPGLVGYWNMNEGTGNTVTDLTSNGNNGTRL